MAQLEAMWQDDDIEYIFAESETFAQLEEDDEDFYPTGLDEVHETDTSDQDYYGGEDDFDLHDKNPPFGVS